LRDRYLSRILIAVVFFIVYGSLYPWHFAWHDLPASPLWILLHSWDARLSRRDIADFCVNVALYLPLGMAGYLAFRKHRIAGPVVIGVLLSATVEMLQLFTPNRHCSTFDLLNNSLGSVAGVLCGRVFENLARPRLEALGRWRSVDRSALALLFCWAGSMLFPLFPITSLPSLRQQAVLFAQGPWFPFIPFFSGAIVWLVCGRLFRAAGVRSPEFWLALSLLLVPAQFVIVFRHPAPVDFLASITGFLLFFSMGRSRATEKAWAWGFIALLVLRGLAPFHFTFTRPQEFNWVPFGPFLAMDWQAGIVVLLGKVFYYGTAVWLVRAAGVRWRVAALSVALVLTALELLQIGLPGRTPEITDPLLALMLGGGLHALSPHRHSGEVPPFAGIA